MLGIVSVMKRYPSRAVLAIACDMPNMSRECLQDLIACRRKDKFATLYFAAGFLQPLCAIYEARAVAALTDSLNRGHRSLQRVLRTHDCKIIQAPADRDFFNVNTRADLAALST